MKKDKILGIQELAGTDLWEPIVSIYSQLHVLKYHIEIGCGVIIYTMAIGSSRKRTHICWRLIQWSSQNITIVCRETASNRNQHILLQV